MPNTDDQSGWLKLLSSLTDEELHRYGKIAAEQRRNEWHHGWAQIACVIGSLAAFAWGLRDCLADGLSWRAAYIFGLAVALGYWPYRQAVVRHLWGRHCKAVEHEVAQRRSLPDR